MSPGPPQSAPRRPAGRSIIITVILSILIPGLGHVYTGRYGRALVWFAGALIIGVILDQQATLTTTALVLLSVLGLAAAGDAVVLMKRFPKVGP